MFKNLMPTAKRDEAMGLKIFSLVLSFVAVVLTVINLCHRKKGYNDGYNDGYKAAKQLYKK